MVLDAQVVVDRDDFRLDVAVSVDEAETLAVLGPNGAGKTTLLRSLAGLTPIRSGRIRVDQSVLDDPTHNIFVPAEERPVGLVFQDFLLFPHMSVIENVAFGLRARGTERERARSRAAQLLEWVGLTGYAERRPSQLSGGQSQRVALARALAIDPRLLLLDEPLAALDVATRRHVRGELHSLLGTIMGARILVTHEPRDAMVLADRIAIIENGSIVQIGTIETLTVAPATPYVEELFGKIS